MPLLDEFRHMVDRYRTRERDRREEWRRRVEEQDSVGAAVALAQADDWRQAADELVDAVYREADLAQEDVLARHLKLESKAARS